MLSICDSKKPNGSRRDAKAIADTAHKFREVLGIENRLAPNVLEVIELLLTKLIPHFELMVCSDRELPGSVEAFAQDEPPRIVVRESIYLAASMCDPRARMTLAHELGHIVLQHRGTHARAKFSKWREVEHEANVFARQFLMPDHLVKNFNCAAEVSRYFNVTRAAAEDRLREVAGPVARENPFAELQKLLASKAGQQVYSEIITDEIKREEGVQDAGASPPE